MSTQDKIQAQLLKVVAEQMGRPLDHIELRTNIITDLGADSLDQIELVMAIEDEFGIELVDEEIQDFYTVQQMLDHLVKEVARQS